MVNLADIPCTTVDITEQLLQQKEKEQEKQTQIDVPTIETKNQSSLTESMKQFLSTQEDFIWCPAADCGFVFENSGPGEDEVQTFDEEMSEEAKRHYNCCRFRCRKCSETFCSECKAVPYHFGKTCEEIKRKNETVICRFCEEPVPTVQMSEHEQAIASGAPRLDHCDSCNNLAYQVSRETFACKHANYYTETFFSPEKCECLHPDCCQDIHDTNLEDFCGICGVDPLKRYPVVKLTCSHVYHTKCITERLKTGWTTNNISMSFCNCPLCNKSVDVFKGGYYMEGLRRAKAIRNDLRNRMAAQLEALQIDIGRIPADADFVDEGLRKLNYYECNCCKSLYFGGVHECGPQVEMPKEELICSGCRGCKQHGSDHLVFKCRYCCSMATYFCFGHSHFCTPCHDKFTNWVETDFYQYLSDSVPQCPGPDKCPLGCAHPPNGEEHCLGCSACKDIFDLNQQHLFTHPDKPEKHVGDDELVARKQADVVRNLGGNAQAHRFLPKDNEAPAIVPRRPVGNRINNLLNVFQKP